MASLTRGIPLSKISPKFLHSNATSHTWPFSAVAELIDNAYDPDVSARELQIDKCVIHGKPCLVFEDDGAGMNFEQLLKMLSFGYCEKDAFEQNISHLPIGHYGNGFKSGSMRLGRDAVVFTVCNKSASVGFLSQTYLGAIGADCVFVPIIEYRLPHQRFKSQESRNNMEAILTHSPFRTEQDLKAELRTILAHRSSTGTRIVLYNLKRHRTGKLELDFESDSTDIRNPEAHEVDLTSVYHRTSQVDSSEYMRSLRVYCGLLFLRPRMKIYIRGEKVKTKLISKSLSSTEIDVYKPTWLDKPLRITFGFNPKTRMSEDYGVMFYHRNRLIKPYEKLGYQKQPNDLGMGVVGVVQVDFLKPIHNKQDFEKDEKYNAIMSSIGLKLNDYWNEKNGQQQQGPTATPVSSQNPDWLWVQCDRCLKWRRLPDSYNAEELPDRWFCHMNPDPTHNRCDIPEEPEDEDEAVRRPTYEKTFKKKQEERKRQKQAEIAKKEAELKAREAALEAAQRQHQLNEVTSSHQSQRDIAHLQRALREAKRREEDHKRLIVRIQNQKRQLARQQTSLVEAVTNLQTANNDSAELLDVAAALTDESPVSSTSGKGKKRRSSSSSGGGGKKVMNITTEQGDMMTIERADTEDEDEDDNVDNIDDDMDFKVEMTDIADEEGHPTDADESSAHLQSSPPPASTASPPSGTATPTSAASPPVTDAPAAAAASPTTDIPPATASSPAPATTPASASSPAPATTPAPASSPAPATPPLNDTVTATPPVTDATTTDTPPVTDATTTDIPPAIAATPPPAASPAASASTSATNPTAVDTPPLPTATSTPTIPSSRQSRRAAKAASEANVIDLTLDEDDQEDQAANTSEAQDVKPNVEELSRQMQRTKADRGGEGGSGGGEGKAGDLDLVTKVKPEEDSKLGLLRHKYALLTQRFHNLQHNVHKLLSFIVPDINLGSEEDIEHIVTEMIRVNCDQAKAQAVGKS